MSFRAKSLIASVRSFPIARPGLFFFTFGFFVSDSSTLRTEGGAGGPSDFRRQHGLQNQLPQAISARLDIADLLSVNLTCDLENSIVGDSRGGQCLQASERCRIQYMGVIEIPAKGRL